MGEELEEKFGEIESSIITICDTYGNTEYLSVDLGNLHDKIDELREILENMNI